MIQAILVPIIKALAVGAKAAGTAAIKGAGMAAKGAAAAGKGLATAGKAAAKGAMTAGKSVGKSTTEAVKSLMMGSKGGGGTAPTSGLMGSGGKMDFKGMMEKMLKGGFGGGGGGGGGGQQAPATGQLTEMQQNAPMQMPEYTKVTPISQILAQILRGY